MKETEKWLIEEFSKENLNVKEKIAFATGSLKFDDRVNKEEALEIIFKILQGEI